MAVLLTQPYAGYATGTVVNINTATELALIAQSRAVASTVASTTTGAVIANLNQGICAVAAAAGSIVITNNLCDASTHVTAYVSQAAADVTLLRVERIVPAAGSFTIYGTAAATATTLIAWRLENYGASVLN